MKNNYIIQITGVIFCFLFLAIGIGSAFSMSSGVSSTSSSGGFSSSSSTSSNLGFSSSTLVMTGGTPSKPTPSPTPAGGPGTIPTNEIIPSQWQPGTRSGTFFDPFTQSSWFFDNVLQKFYSPTYGWFLVTQYTKEGKIFAQFYYDPKTGVFRDMKTGSTIMSPASTTQQSGITGQPGQQPSPVSSVQLTPSPTPDTSPIIATGQQSTPVTPSSSTHPCRIACISCPSGFCDDCNQNGVCDDSESSGTPVVAGTQSDTQPGGVSEEPQKPIQINLPVTPSGVSAEGGLSEDPQSTIYYQLVLPQGGIRPILACDPNQDCEHCLDIDEDGACSILDYAIILCNEKWGLDYMGSRDNICDTEILLIMNCSEPSDCTIAEFCRDMNGDGLCDEELETEELL